MLNTKTIEEIRSAVLAYCEEACPDDDVMFQNRLWLIRDIDGFVCQRQNKANQGTPVFHVHAGLDADDPHWAIAYAVLHLEARDAVEAERARNAALVAALEEITIKCPRSIASTLAGVALAANTEKGGAVNPFYPKLLAKLKKIWSGEMPLIDYINEVESKVKGGAND